MRNIGMTTAFQNIRETQDIALNISMRIFQTVSNTCLGCEIYDSVETVIGKELF